MSTPRNNAAASPRKPIVSFEGPVQHPRPPATRRARARHRITGALPPPGIPQAPDVTRPQLMALLVTAAGVSAVYALGLRGVPAGGRLAMLWPALGCAVGLAILGSRQLRVALAAVLGLAGFVVLRTGSWPLPQTITATLLLTGVFLLMAWSVRRFGMRRLRRPLDLGILLAVTAVVAVLSAVPALVFTTRLPSTELAHLSAWAIPLAWGVICVAPVLLTARWPSQWPLRRAPEFLMATGFTTAAGIYIFHVVTPGAPGLFGWPYLVILGLVWLAVRLGVSAVAPVACAVSWYGSVKTLAGEGPFTAAAPTDLIERLLIVQLFLLVITATVLLVAVLTDERARNARDLAHLALQDPVTGLPNRRALCDHLEMALARLNRRPGTVAVLFCDLDRFKQVNDTVGHEVGDRLLAEVARRLQAGLRPEDVVARQGGDEFVVVCEGLRGDRDAADLAIRLQDRLRPAWRYDGQTFHPTMSVGISSTSDPGTVPEELLRLADVAMYRAKAAGRDRVRVYDETLNQGVRHRAALHDALRRALTNGDLELHYQPIVDLTRNTVIGSEALVRFRSQDGGVLMPTSFLPIAEHTGLIDDLGIWVMRRAFADLRQQQQRCGTSQLISINVSPRQLRRPEFAADLIGLARERGIDPHHVMVEVTEAVLLPDAGDSGAALAALRNEGVRIALDDFGTGYSSLTRLSEVPVDLVKIDRSFTAHAGTNPRRTAVLASILAVARELSLTVVAEGIETVEQRDLLIDLSCPLGQGYLWSRPVPMDEAEWLSAPTPDDRSVR